MDNVFVRNFVIFTAILLACTGFLLYGLISGGQELEETDQLVTETHEIIIEAEQLSGVAESMLATQRAYLITGDNNFFARYEGKRDNFSNTIAHLSELTIDNPSQQSRLQEIRNYFTLFSKKLEERAQDTDIESIKRILGDVEEIDTLKNSIVRINDNIIAEEYSLLQERVKRLDGMRAQYQSNLMIGIVVGTTLLLVLNAFLLNVQRKRTRAEADLRDSEDRFALAVDGTDDGIFDWDIKKETVFYSRRFFEMLGYERKAFTGHTDDFTTLIHPEDKERVWTYLENYMSGKLSEYRIEFRMRHDSGRWIWIQSRGKALFDKKGTAYRMVGSHTDITHVVRERNKLKAERNEANEANRAKSEFLAHMSHEIRTPLTAISGIAEIFDKMKNDLEDRPRKLVGTLLSSTSSLKDLINDILDFSKIESGELELDEENFVLNEIFENVISMMSLKASEKGISFVFTYDKIKDRHFYGDAKRIRQVLINLINNAIKFTDEGGVTVQAYVDNRDGVDFLRIDIADTGIGIAPEDFDLIFERFKQADSSVSRKYGGTGLGLPISRNLSKLMGGDIFISSETGKGSTFSLLLPLKLDDNEFASSKSDPKTDEKLTDKLRAVLKDKRKILLVEDYEGNVAVLSYILDDINAEYDIANTGVEAVRLWENHHYDVVLMDIQMPEMDGFTATKKIRTQEKQKKLNRTPIIGMTAHALVGDKDKCIEAGMDAYLPKPIVEVDLKREILKFLHEKKKAA